MRSTIALFLLLRLVFGEVLDNQNEKNKIPPLLPNFDNQEIPSQSLINSRHPRSPSETTTQSPRTPIYIPDLRVNNPKFRDYAVEEGSGMTPNSNRGSMMSSIIFQQFPTVTPTPTLDTYVNGYITNRQYRFLGQNLLGDELMAVNRPGGPNEFIAFWVPPNSRPVWGKVFVDSTGKTAGSFILNDRIYNTSDPSVFAQTRVLTWAPDYEEKFNFRYSWVPIGRLDSSMAITVINDSRQCKQTVPAVLVDRVNGNYQYLGEADLINRVFRYTYAGLPHSIIDSTQFQTNVRVIVKLRCQCSCGL